MPNDARQTLRGEQSLTLTPQLKRSLEILQAPTLELSKIIEQELQTNPALEELAPSENTPPKTIGENVDDLDFDEPQPTSESDAQAAQKSRDFFLNSIPDRISLQEYLLTEARLDAKDERVSAAFANLAGSLDERGFLYPDAIKRAKAEGFEQGVIDEALEMLRNCEPSGIGAFDMRDSLMLQLEHKSMGNSLAHKILEYHFDLLMKRKVEEIAQAENRSVEQVENAIAEIAKLHTSPASEFESDDTKYVSVDIIYTRDENGEFQAELSKDGIPKLGINADYRRMMAEGKLRASEESYIREKIRDGKFLMEAIEQRQKTLSRIAKTILEKQRPFFEEGVLALKPMTMRDIADELDLHQSTIGRAIADKYADTPFGILPLKFFFDGGYETNEGESVASSSVKNRIKEIIENEDAKSPLSDSKIVSILAEENIELARRTVAKYREELGIAPKNFRRRF